MVLQAFMEGLQGFMHLEIWLYLLAGVVMGLAFGVIPGLTSLVGMSILMPFVFLMTPEQALPLFIGICAVSYTAGAITAILLNIPGTGANAATLIDGFPMTQKGEGARALGAALTSSGMGGIISVILALAMVFLVLPLVFAIRSADLVFLILMGISFIVVLSRGSMLKGLIAGGFGFIISLTGLHVVTGAPRFTLGTVYLLEGYSLVPVLLGLFAIPEIINMGVRGGLVQQLGKVDLSMRGVIQGVKDVFRHKWLWLRSSIIGYIIGLIPGVGASTAIFVAYGQGKQTSKYPEKWGTGIVEGVIAPESANNAKEGGALLTTLVLGIPGSGEMVILLGALMMLGITPGLQMMTTYLPLSFSLLQVLFIGSFLGAVICLLIAPYLARVSTIPARFLFPLVTIIVFIGAFAYHERFLDLATLLIFGMLGVAMRKYGFNRPAMLLGYILGDLFEKYLFIAYRADGPLFFMTPISLSIITITIALFCFAPIKSLRARRTRREAKQT